MSRVMNEFRNLGPFSNAVSQEAWLDRANKIGRRASKTATLTSSDELHQAAADIFRSCIEPASSLWGNSSFETVLFRRAYANELVSLHQKSEARRQYDIALNKTQQGLRQGVLADKLRWRSSIDQLLIGRINLAAQYYQDKEYETALAFSKETLRAVQSQLGSDRTITERAERAVNRAQDKISKAQQRQRGSISNPVSSSLGTGTSSSGSTLEHSRARPDLEDGASPNPSIVEVQLPVGTCDNIDSVVSTDSQCARPNTSTFLDASIVLQNSTCTPDAAVTPDTVAITTSHADSAEDVNITNHPNDLPAVGAHASHTSTESSIPPERRDSLGHIRASVEAIPDRLIPHDEVLLPERSRSTNCEQQRERFMTTYEPEPPVSWGLQHTTAANTTAYPLVTTSSAVRDTSVQGQSLARTSGMIESDKWLKERLSASHSLFIQRPEDHFTPVQPPGKERVRIAILDTGIDYEHPDIIAISSRIKGRFGCLRQPDDHHDNDGHGTHLTALINTVAPESDLYIIKVFERTTNGDVQSVVRGIKHAIEQKVDIISMSFGFAQSTPEFRSVLLEATVKDILMFAAATNEGGNVDEPMFPARSPLVFCIHASTAEGVWAGLNTDGGPTHYSTLGIDVKSARAGYRRDVQPGTPRHERRDGTSVACAVAAGIAALVLEFTRQPCVHRDLYGYEFDRRKLVSLHTMEGMDRVFRRMQFTDSTRTKCRYLAPWYLLSPNADPTDIRSAARECMKKLDVWIGT